MQLYTSLFFNQEKIFILNPIKLCVIIKILIEMKEYLKKLIIIF